MARALAISRSGWLSWSVRMFLSERLQQALVEAVEAALGVALAPEDLDDLGAREGLLEEDGQLGHLLLLALVDAIEAPADHLHHQRDEGKGDEGGQGEEGLAHQHHRDQGHDGSRVAHELDEHRRRQAGQPRSRRSASATSARPECVPLKKARGMPWMCR